jgi:hypothetical protein
MIGAAGYDTCMGSKLAAFLAQSGKANALALSESNVVVVHCAAEKSKRMSRQHRPSRHATSQVEKSAAEILSPTRI